MRDRNIELSRPINSYNNKRELHPLPKVNKTFKSKTVVSSILENTFVTAISNENMASLYISKTKNSFSYNLILAKINNYFLLANKFQMLCF